MATTCSTTSSPYIGVSAKIEVVEVGGIERSVGKAKRVIDKRP